MLLGTLKLTKSHRCIHLRSSAVAKDLTVEEVLCDAALSSCHGFGLSNREHVRRVLVASLMDASSV